ncbi:MAG: hypothetical protein ABI304_02400 [Rudaea sp.]
MPPKDPWPPILTTRATPVTPPTHLQDFVYSMQRVAHEFGDLAQAVASDRKLSEALGQAQKQAAKKALEAYNAYF